jgi:MSHA biogenesis protein MshN
MAQGDAEMSVINKMLRDLDSRQVDKDIADVPKAFGHGDLTGGTVALSDTADGMPRQRSAKTWGPVLVLPLLIACAGLVVWMIQRPVNPPDIGPVAALRVPAPNRMVDTTVTGSHAAVARSLVVSEVTPVSAMAALPVAPQSSPMVATTEPMGQSQPSSKAEPAAVVVETTAKPDVKPSTKGGQAVRPVGQLKESTEFSSFKRASRLGPSAQPVVSADKAVLPVTRATHVVAVEAAPKQRPNAAQDVLSQAQERWTLGDRAQAIALLHSAIERLEASPTGNSAALATLVREYVRMTLVQGQTSAAWAVLSSVEQALADVADICALRGNVAQRLGLHPEAVRAYLKGLELRPDEPRWMLGAAVSLAAQGQVGPAAELAEKARLAGALRPDVANYLRQLGVAVRMD